jgi:hemoglobin-like flavoprotein
MSLDVVALRNSFALVAERAPNLTQRFYEILFARHPSVRPLFPAHLGRQEEMLTRALVAVIEHLEDGAWIKDNLRALGAKHVAYGVTEEMYDWVGGALIATLAEVAAEAWTPSVEQAWVGAYGAIAGTMIEGARAAAAPSLAPASAAPASATTRA